MENHHDQGMQRDECNVHLKCKERLRVTLGETASCCYTEISSLLLLLTLNTLMLGVSKSLDLMEVWINCCIHLGQTPKVGQATGYA